ncbi:MAG: MaoC family dehydratase [Oscillospiraceae bacterium]|nr:MaoC family dehydratase [Oscillospiraceae bacterium]
MIPIKQYTYDEITLGQVANFAVTITEDMMSKFRDISGDVNPLHISEDFAKDKGYTGRVVYGMLSASFLSTMAGMYLPGENCVIHAVEVKFPLPVYLGQTLTFTGEVVSKVDAYNTIELKVSATNSNNQKVLRGKIRAGVLK